MSIIEPAYVVSNLQATATETSHMAPSQSPSSSETKTTATPSVDCIDTSKGVTEDEVRALYSQQYNSSNSDDVVHNVSLASTPDVTTWAITVSRNESFSLVLGCVLARKILCL